MPTAPKSIGNTWYSTEPAGFDGIDGGVELHTEREQTHREELRQCTRHSA